MKRPQGMSYAEYKVWRKEEEKRLKEKTKPTTIKSSNPSQRRMNRGNRRAIKEQEKLYQSYVRKFGKEAGVQKWMSRMFGIEMKDEEE